MDIIQINKREFKNIIKKVILTFIMIDLLNQIKYIQIILDTIKVLMFKVVLIDNKYKCYVIDKNI